MIVLEFSRARGVLRTHWRWPVGLAVGLSALVVLWYSLTPSAYRATAALVVDGRGVERLLDTPRDATPPPTTVVTTVQDVIRSDTVLARAIKTLGLDIEPGTPEDIQALQTASPDRVQARAIAAERRKVWLKETKGKLNFVSWLMQRWLPKSITVAQPTASSNMVTVQFDYVDPELAKLMANTLAQSYLDTALELSLAPTRQAALFFENQIQQTRAQLAQAQDARSRFQRENGLVSVSEATDLESALMTEMANAAIQARARGADAAARSSTAAANQASAPEVLQATIVQQLSADLARQRAALAEVSTRLGPMHPQVIAQQHQVEEMSRRLQDEAVRVAESVTLASRSATGGDRAVQGLLQQQRDKVMALKQARERLAVIQRDVDAAQHAYDLAKQNFSSATQRNESSLNDSRLLAGASAPLDPTRPPLLIALMFTLLSGVLLGTGAAFVAEQRVPRMRLDEDVTDELGLPVLSAVPRVRLAPPSAVARWAESWRPRLSWSREAAA